MAARLLPPPGNLLSFAAPTLPPELAATLAASDVPLLLLPVRLETRFFAQPDGASQELRVRVFPDQIHVDSHEPALSKDEVLWGQHFWRQIWHAGRVEAAERLAWQQLADRFDAQRAAWIARALSPTNPADWPAAPVATDKPLPVEPKFAAAATLKDPNGGGWQRAPLARAMPQRWIAVATAKGALVAYALGAPVDREPAVGPDPQDKVESKPDELAIDAGMRWMVDFDDAEKHGLGMRLKVPMAIAQQGIDALVVFGVSSLEPAAATSAMASLLDAHHYTDGLGFLRVGTPTNNSTEASSGWSSQDPMHARSFAMECRAPKVAAGSNADVLARALGFNATVTQASLRTLYDAALVEQTDAKQMAAALWPATWGYYLMNLIGLEGTGLTLDDIAWAREHFIAHVRAFGPLPTLRVGRQPYGLLPVTPLGGDPAKIADARERWLAATLKTLSERLWYPRVPDVARVGRSDDPAQDLSSVMKSDAVSGTYRLRYLLGPRYIDHLRRFAGEDLAGSGWLAQEDAISRTVMNALGFNWHPRLEDAAYAEGDMPIRAPLVQAGELGGVAKLNPNYITSLLADPPLPASETAAPPAMTPATLLNMLLRHSLQLEYSATAARLAARQPGATPLAGLLRERELVNLNAATTVTTWRMLLSRANPATSNAAPGAFLKGLKKFDTADLKPLGELRSAMAYLKDLAPARLEQLLTGTLDLASHRIDAWITSLASRRLAALRAKKGVGMRVGGYGWVLNLKPATTQAPVAAPAGETGPMFSMAGDPGFIHAPSVMQAQTAALLRNTHLNHSRSGAEDVFAVDLSSRRIRLATSLLDGVRQGQPLGALLGYLFERKMHELALDAEIDDFRTLAPLAPVNATPAMQPTEAIAARNVVDGLKLREIYRNVVVNGGFATPELRARLNRCVQALVVLDDAVDAVSDAAIAECAHQAVRGNIVKTGATLQAIASGEAPPPELEVARTPRTGIAATHRVVAVFNLVSAPASPVSPRALAEPQLNAWAGRLLGSFTNIRFAVERLDGKGTVIKTLELRLTALAIAPLDAVYLAPARPGDPAPEIDARALAAGAAKFGILAPGETLRINRQRSATWKPVEIGLDELCELAARARQLFSGARALDARDLIGLQGSFDTRIDAAEFEARAKAARTALTTALAALTPQLKALPTAGMAPVRAAIATLSRFGIGGSAPLPIADGITLLAQAAAVAREAQRRVDLATAAAAPLEMLRAVFGEGFLALPRFSIGNAKELAGSLAASAALQGDDPLAVYPWFQQVQRVREPVSRLGTSLQAAEVAGTGATLRLTVAQLPFVAGERWIGLPVEAGQDMPAGKLSLVVHAASTLDPAKPLAGVLIDEWVEVVPASHETTAIAFQHDAPDQRAPQAMLLAVPAVPGEPWTGAGLHRLLLDTLALAQGRAVDPEALDTAALNPLTGAGAVAEVAHFLPALHFAVNVDGDAIAPDFKSLTT